LYHGCAIPVALQNSKPTSKQNKPENPQKETKKGVVIAKR
jgi:hypothetical protein